ncbi:hypothetical protein PV328_004285 [Microctonus aethiopoides]|uniref:Uncharacterized protein n=1 Tax=Microctonus aethiopoides TaxID=144406 RepID=A0AA39FA67_9HYME|nr:hypothetical protein PV328_004285 [Microctonus aethiopoides]
MMKLPIEYRKYIEKFETWIRKPRWRRHNYQHKRRKYNLIALTLLKISAYDFWRMIISYGMNNDYIKNSEFNDSSPFLHWHSLHSCLTTETIMNNNNILSNDLLCPRLIKNEKGTKRSKEIAIHKQSTYNILSTTPVESKYFEFDSSSMNDEYDDNYNSTMDSSAINESFICQTALDTVKKYNYNINVTIEEKTSNSVVNKLDRRKNINLKLTSSSGSCKITENITICLDRTDNSSHNIVKECHGPKLNENNCEKHETIFVFIKEENPNLKKCFNKDRCFESCRNVSTSTSDILSLLTKDNARRIIDSLPICMIKKESTSWRSVLPACAVKNIEQIPRYKNNSLEEVTEKNNNQFIPMNNNLKITESLSTTNIIKEISLDSSESSSTSSSTSLDSVHVNNYK